MFIFINKMGKHNNFLFFRRLTKGYFYAILLV